MNRRLWKGILSVKDAVSILDSLPATGKMVEKSVLAYSKPGLRQAAKPRHEFVGIKRLNMRGA